MAQSQGDQKVHSPHATGSAKKASILVHEVGVEIKVSRKRTKTILSDVSATISPGRMVAIMGPSGCGKSTLLDVMSRRKTSGTVHGDVSIAGARPTLGFIRSQTGYAEQKERLLSQVTVREQLLYTSQLKLPKETPREAKDAKVDELIRELGLSEVQNVKVGSERARGISGGQSKRLAIACQLLVEPLVLFLDEPTTGLDSYTAMKATKLVSRYAASKGITVVASIHGPSTRVFNMFDRLLLLQKGEEAFFGPIENRNDVHGMLSFIKGNAPREPRDLMWEENVAEYVIELTTASQEEGDQSGWASFTRGWSKSQLRADVQALIAQAAAQYIADEKRGMRARASRLEVGEGQAGGGDAQRALERLHESFEDNYGQDTEHQDGRKHAGSTRGGTITPAWWAVGVMAKYRSIKNLTDPEFIVSRIVDNVVQCVIISTLFVNAGEDYTSDMALRQISAILFFIAVVPGFGAAAYTVALSTERSVTYRELADGLYNPLTYLAVRFADELVVSAIMSIVYSAAIFFALSLRGSFGLFFLTYFELVLFGVIAAYAFAAFCPTLEVANAGLPFLIQAMVFFVGFLISLSAMPRGWIFLFYVNPFTYGWRAFMINQYENEDGTSPLLNGEETVLEFYDMDGTGSKWLNLLWIFLFILGFFLIAWVSLRFIRYERR